MVYRKDWSVCTRIKVAVGILLLFGVTIPPGFLIARYFVRFFNRWVESKEEAIPTWVKSALLDPQHHFQITWHLNKSVDNGKIIVFDIEVRAKGWVGFGISDSGGMDGADLIIGGVDSNGKVYFEDRYAEGKETPKIDKHQDWTLINASEIDGVTRLKLSRPLFTCDSEDVAITGVAQSFIWAVGDTDNVTYHGLEKRGVFPENILDPPRILVDLSIYKTIDLVSNVTMPAKDTVYFCAIHKSPSSSKRQQIVAFGPKINNTLGLDHTQHLTLYVCDVDKKNASYFDTFVDQECRKRGEDPLPVYKVCKEIYAWAMGVTTLVMPKDVGFALDELSEDKQRYYMVEFHFHNPSLSEHLKFETGMQIYYTEELRPIEAGLLSVMASNDWRLTIPPNSTEFRVAGHCIPSCTKEIGPESYTFFSLQSHAHKNTKLRIRHFRGEKELPWISNHKAFANKFQISRDIPFTKFLQSDQLTVECQFDNRWAKGKTTIGGWTGDDEIVCAANLFYYPKGRLISCGSHPSAKRFKNVTGIQNFTNPDAYNPIISSPVSEKGLRYSEYVNKHVEWTSELISKIQKEYINTPQQTFCFGPNMVDYFEGIQDRKPLRGSYPKDIKEYSSKSKSCQK